MSRASTIVRGLALLLGGAAAIGVARAEEPAADSGGRTLVIEAVVGHETSEVHRYLPEVAAALRPALSGRALAEAVDARFGAAPSRLDAAALAELAAQVRQAERNLFFSGIHEREAVDELESARARLVDAQATLAYDADARALYEHVLLKLARAYQVAHGPEAARLAEARMLERVRNLPDRPVDPERSEPELYQLYQRVQATLPARVRLAVGLPPGARAWLSGRPVGEAADARRGGAASVAVYPGEQRLLVATARGDGRVHRVTVGGRDVRLEIDADFEAALRSQPFVGLAYESPAARAAAEPRWVGTLARGLGATRVFVLAADGADGRPAVGVWGYRIDGAGARLVASSMARGASGVVAPSEVAGAAARVAAALDGSPAPAGVTIMSGRPAASRPGDGGVRLVGRGAAAIVEPAGGERTAAERTLAAIGWGALGAGLPLAVTGAALWRHGELGTAAPLVGGGLSLAVAGTVWAIGAPAGRRGRTRAALVTAALWTAAATVAGVLAAR